MGKNSQTPSQAELRRRQRQSIKDKERYQQERWRDFEQALSFGLSAIINTAQQNVSKTSPIATKHPDTMPQHEGSHSTRTFNRYDSGIFQLWNKFNSRCSLFNNIKYSDTTVYLGGSKIPFPAHRLVLGISSPYFDDALTSGFKEAKTHEFTFDKESPHALWRVFQYMYTGDYVDEPSEGLDTEGPYPASWSSCD